MSETLPIEPADVRETPLPVETGEFVELTRERGGGTPEGNGPRFPFWG
ncbi:hypothetical protein [Streptomyces varsoviensis]|nr:hypothetical protein [Streptomyces varsoviensis]